MKCIHLDTSCFDIMLPYYDCSPHLTAWRSIILTNFKDIELSFCAFAGSSYIIFESIVWDCCSKKNVIVAKVENYSIVKLPAHTAWIRETYVFDIVLWASPWPILNSNLKHVWLLQLSQACVIQCLQPHLIGLVHVLLFQWSLQLPILNWHLNTTIEHDQPYHYIELQAKEAQDIYLSENIKKIKLYILK